MNLGKLRSTPNAPLFGGTGGLVDPVSPARALYNEVLQRFADAPDDLAIMASTIISEVALSRTVSTTELVFNLRSDTPNPTNAIRTTEQRLQTRDAFVVDSIGLFFGNQVAAGTVASATIFQQFDNAATVANGGFGTAGALAIRQAYNGNLNGQVNTVQFLSNLSATQFKYIDTAQASSATTKSAENSLYGYVDLTPAMTVRGSDTSQFSLRIPDPALFDAGADNVIVGRLLLRGLLIQGGAQFAL